MSQTPKIAVLGGGSFGTALANTIASNEFSVFQWMRNADYAAEVESSRENSRYLPGFTLSPQLQVTANLEYVLTHSDLVFISVPSASFREVSEKIKPLLRPEAMVVSTTKGFDKGDKNDFTLMSQILEEVLPDHPIGVLSGPNFAKEMIAQQLTGSVIASESDALRDRVQNVLCSATFRVYSNEDRYGVELAGALKNIYAIIVGMAEARQCGHNTLAMLMTRALAEMGRFSYRLGADPMTLIGLAGVGDLMLTCGSSLSRNYRMGYALGCGKTYKQAREEIGQVVEGINTLRLVKQKSEELGVHMPLVSALYSLMFDQQSVDSIIKRLMSSEYTSDVDFSAR